jgi:hypothetical protein
MASKATSGLDPLKDLLGDVLARLEALEAKAGVTVPVTSAATPKSPVPVKAAFHGTCWSIRRRFEIVGVFLSSRYQCLSQYHQPPHFYT